MHCYCPLLFPILLFASPTLQYRMEIVWPNVFGWIWVHVMGLYGSTLLLDMKLKTGLWLVITLWMTAMVWTEDMLGGVNNIHI